MRGYTLQVALIYFKVLSKYVTGLAEERHDIPVAMAIVMAEEDIYRYPDVRIDIKCSDSLCRLSCHRSTASSKASSAPSAI